jgi:hypothetical protein
MPRETPRSGGNGFDVVYFREEHQEPIVTEEISDSELQIWWQAIIQNE